MKREIRIELLAVNEWTSLRNETPPEGVTVRGPISTQLASAHAPAVLPYIIATVSFAGGFAVDVAKDVLKERAKEWLVDVLAKRMAARPLIRGDEPKDRSELERLISDEIDIGKND